MASIKIGRVELGKSTPIDSVNRSTKSPNPKAKPHHLRQNCKNVFENAVAPRCLIMTPLAAEERDLQPNFPPEIELFIFTLAAYNHLEMHPALLLVCHRVKVWCVRIWFDVFLAITNFQVFVNKHRLEPIIRQHLIVAPFGVGKHPRSPLHLYIGHPWKSHSIPGPFIHVRALFLTIPMPVKWLSLFPNIKYLHCDFGYPYFHNPCLPEEHDPLRIVLNLPLEKLSYGHYSWLYGNLRTFHSSLISRTLTHLLLPSIDSFDSELLSFVSLSHLAITIFRGKANGQVVSDWIRDRKSALLRKFLSRPHFRLCVLAGDSRTGSIIEKGKPWKLNQNLFPHPPWAHLFPTILGLNSPKIVWYLASWSPWDDFIKDCNGEKTIWEIGEEMLEARQRSSCEEP